MQYGALPHITCCVKQLLCHHFSDDRIIYHQFSTAWPPRSPTLNPCDFWLWGYLKTMVYHDPITSLSNLRESIERFVCSILQFMLHSTIEHVILCFQMVADKMDITLSMFCKLL